MKTDHAVNVERQAARVIEDFLARLPNSHIDHIEREPISGDATIDVAVESHIAGRPLTIIVEVKSSGQPRHIRQAAEQLRRYMRNHKAHVVPIVMAPYLSPQARDAARSEQVGYLDFMGNAFIAAEGIYIEREVAGQPEAERRALRSLYKPKSARILRRILREPERHWRTAELADAAGVSAGLVSNVSIALRDRAWAEQTDLGFTLVDPSALLDSWAENYEPPRGEEFRRYTTLHGRALVDRLHRAGNAGGQIALASFSAADWLAPFVRHPNTYFYADETGLAALEDILDLHQAPKGANVIIVVPEEDGVLDDATRVAEEIVVTSPVQTYLDLIHTGDRGSEGAAELRKRLLDWQA
jgi:hypothetical protein